MTATHPPRPCADCGRPFPAVAHFTLCAVCYGRAQRGLPPREQREPLVIPGCPADPGDGSGWPSHKAKARRAPRARGQR